jgi:hypothetical protein
MSATDNPQMNLGARIGRAFEIELALSPAKEQMNATRYKKKECCDYLPSLFPF